MSVRLAFDRLPATAPRPVASRLRSVLRSCLAQLGRNVLKYVLLRDPSIRSQHFGGEQMADLAVRFLATNDIRGSYLEFGLYRGSAFAQFYHAFRRHAREVPMFGFDSFQGLPAAHGADAQTGFRRYAEGYFSCSEAELRAELARRRVPAGAYTLIPGFYADSLRPALYERRGLAPCALVLVDCFYYESTLAALRFVTPILQSGTVLMCNSYFRFRAHPDYGERGALEEWCRKNPAIGLTEYAKFGTAGRAFVVHLPAEAAAAGPAMRETATG